MALILHVVIHSVNAITYVLIISICTCCTRRLYSMQFIITVLKKTASSRELITMSWTECSTAYRVFSLGTHVRILPLHGRHAGVQQRTVVNWEKALSPSLWDWQRQLTIQVLHITTQITTSSVYANLVQVALCVTLCNRFQLIALGLRV